MTSVEFCSALNRKVREGTVTPLQRDGLMEVLLRDTQAFIHVPLLSPQTGLIHSALRLITEEGLRGPDAIQLASALHVMEGWGEETLFSCADRRLIEAAHHLGLPAVNPEDAWHIHS
jgi:predicted nucleic acid-binding protein